MCLAIKLLVAQSNLSYPGLQYCCHNKQLGFVPVPSCKITSKFYLFGSFSAGFCRLERGRQSYQLEQGQF